MKEQEDSYIQKIRRVVSLHTDPVEIIDELATLNKPNADVSVNTSVLIEYIDNLEFERNDGMLDGYIDDYDAAERKLASKNLKKIKRILSDIDSKNWYKQIFLAELAYSRLAKGEYTYKIINKKLNANNIKQARQQKDKTRASLPPQHPDDPTYKLEDIRINVEVVDKNNKTIELQKFLLN